MVAKLAKRFPDVPNQFLGEADDLSKFIKIEIVFSKIVLGIYFVFFRAADSVFIYSEFMFVFSFVVFFQS